MDAEVYFLGGVAVGLSKTAAAPVERIKLLLQTQGDNAAISKPYKGIMDCLLRVSQEQGILAFWRGNWANVLRYFPTQSLHFAFNDLYQLWFSYPRSDGFWPCLFGNAVSGKAYVCPRVVSLNSL